MKITKSFIFIALIISNGVKQSIAQHSGIPKVAVEVPCVDYHKKACMQLVEKGFVYNGQSKSGLFAKGQKSVLNVVLYKGTDYFISVCHEEKEPVAFTIKNKKTGEAIYDNAADNMTQQIEFSNENSVQAIIEVTIPGTGKEDKIKGQPGLCAGVLIETKRSEKKGF